MSHNETRAVLKKSFACAVLKKLFNNNSSLKKLDKDGTHVAHKRVVFVNQE